MEVMGTGHGGNGSAVTEQRTNEALLILAGQTHDLCVCDGGTSGGLGRRDHEVAERSALHLRGTPHGFQSLRSDARLKALGAGRLIHDEAFTTIRTAFYRHYKMDACRLGLAR